MCVHTINMALLTDLTFHHLATGGVIGDQVACISHRGTNTRIDVQQHVSTNMPARGMLMRMAVSTDLVIHHLVIGGVIGHQVVHLCRDGGNGLQQGRGRRRKDGKGGGREVMGWPMRDL